MASNSIVNLRVNYDGVDMAINVDQETADRIIQDPEFAVAFMQTNFRSSSEETRIENRPSTSADVVRMPPSHSGEDKNEVEPRGESFVWNEAIIRLLIHSRLSHDAKFQSPKEKKKKLWVNVSNLMKTTAPKIAKSVTGDLCDKKWRNLIITYKKILATNSKTGRGRTSWAYFDILNDALGNRANITPPPDMLGSSIEPDERYSTLGETGTTSGSMTPPPSTVDSPPSRASTSAVCTPEVTPQKLFSRSRKRANEKSMLQQELEYRREREKEKKARWEDKKKAEEERTSAIKSLADAITLLANKK